MLIKKYDVYLEQSAVQEEEIGYLCDSNENLYKLATALKIDKSNKERLFVIAVDAKGNVIGVNEASSGSVISSTVSPAEILKFVLLCNAPYFFLVHNHPSGDVEPSSSDMESTERVYKAGEIVGVRLLDHMIVGDGYHSMKKEGTFKF